MTDIIRKVSGTQINDTVCSIGGVYGNILTGSTTVKSPIVCGTNCLISQQLTLTGLANKTTENKVLYIGSSGVITCGTVSGGTAGITGATNGLSVCGTKIQLGGELIHDTTITGNYNINFTDSVIGGKVFCINQNGNGNVCYGYNTLSNNVSGLNNVAIASNSLCSNTSGCNNVAVGTNTLIKNTTGCNNIALGYQALSANTSGHGNIVHGYQALMKNTTGVNNIAIGASAGFNNVSGSGSVFLGTCAGYNETGSNKLYIANNATTPLIYGEFDNAKLCIRGALYVSGLTNASTVNMIYYNSTTNELSYGVALTGLTDSIGWSNFTNKSTTIGCGTKALAGYTGLGNTVYGVYSLCSNTTGCYNTANGFCTLAKNTSGCNNTAIGSQALSANTIGCGNTAHGYQALIKNTTGTYNTAIGAHAGFNNVSGSGSVFLGTCAGYNETASNRLYIANHPTKSLIYGEFDNYKLCIRGKLHVSGLTNASKNNIIYYDTVTNELTYCTMPPVTTTLGWSNLANKSTVVGCGTPISATTVIGNTVYGVSVLSVNTTGYYNTGIGAQALYSNTTGCYNTAIGYRALSANTGNNNNNTAIGAQSLSKNTSGFNNTAIGASAGFNNVSGSGSVFLGTCAGYNETGSNKLYIANHPTKSLIYGEFDNAKLCIRGKLYVSGLTNVINTNAIYYNQVTNELTYGISPTGSTLKSIGWSNTGNKSTVAGCCTQELIGYGGSANSVFGVGALSANTTGAANVAIGYQALAKNSGSLGNANVAIGYQTMCSNTSGFGNVAHGYQTMCSNTSGCQNVAIGYRALINNTTGCHNVAIGNGALSATTTSKYNIAFGVGAMSKHTTGDENTAIGYYSLHNLSGGVSNNAMGNYAGYNNLNGSSNIFIGTCAGYNETGSNKLYIANNATTALIYGDFLADCVVLPILKLRTQPATGNAATDRPMVWNPTDCTVKSLAPTSDCRLKCNIQPITNSLSILDNICGYSAEYNELSECNGCKQYVFLAQEVEEKLPLAVANDVVINDVKYKSVYYEQLIPVLWNIVKEQTLEMKAQDEKLKILEDKLNALQ